MLSWRPLVVVVPPWLRRPRSGFQRRLRASPSLRLRLRVRRLSLLTLDISADPLYSPSIVAQAPVKPAKKAAPARKSRATKAAAAPVVVLSDAEDEEEEESTTPAPAPARATRGKRAVVEQSSAEEVKATATRASRATKALSENTAPVAVAKPKRAAASKASKVVEEAPVATTTGRALRARR